MIEVQDLYKNFGDLEVLKGISTEIKSQEVVSIIGPSGSGKSTFLRCLNLLEDVTDGDILIEGVSLTDKRSEEHTSELQSRGHIVCRLLLEKKKTKISI